MNLTGIPDRIRRLALSLFLVSLMLFLPLRLSYYPRRVLILTMILVIVTVSVNLLTGYAGQMSLGHSGFYAIGAYTSALLTTKFGLPFWQGLAGAALLAAGIGFIVGLPSLRIKGIYLAIVSLIFASIVYLLVLNLRGITKGASGVLGIPRPQIISQSLSDDRHYYYLVLFVVALTIKSVHHLGNSSLGRALRAIRDDEVKASTLGYDVSRYKLFAFAASAFYTGLAGSLYAHYAGFISPEAFPPSLSITILVMAIVGGLGRVSGSVVGTAVVYPLPEVLRFARSYWNVVFGLLLLLTILFLPEGLISLWDRLRVRASRVLRKRQRRSGDRPGSDFEGRQEAKRKDGDREG